MPSLAPNTLACVELSFPRFAGHRQAAMATNSSCSSLVRSNAWTRARPRVSHQAVTVSRRVPFFDDMELLLTLLVLMSPVLLSCFLPACHRDESLGKQNV